MYNFCGVLRIVLQYKNFVLTNALAKGLDASS